MRRTIVWNQAVNMDPLDAALRAVTETQSLLRSLLVSSESFDYPRAKLALEAMTLKVKELSRLKSRLATKMALDRVQAGDVHVSNICMVDFTRSRSLNQK